MGRASVLVQAAASAVRTRMKAVNERQEAMMEGEAKEDEVVVIDAHQASTQATVRVTNPGINQNMTILEAMAQEGEEEEIET